MTVRYHSLSTKISAIVLAVIALTSLAIGCVSYIIYRNNLIESNAATASMIAESVAAGIDPAQMETIIEGGEKDANYEVMQTFINEAKIRTGVTYLYVLCDYTASEVIYFLDGHAPGDDAPLDFMAHEDKATTADEAFIVFDNGKSMPTGIYESQGFGTMISGFAPIVSASGQVLGVVGTDLLVEEAMKGAQTFLIEMLAIVLGAIVVSGVFFRIYIGRKVGAPIKTLAQASQVMAKGELDLSLPQGFRDEIGQLVDAFNEMVESSKHQAAIMEALAAGDLTVNVTPRGPSDTMGIAMSNMASNLGEMFVEINNASAQVSSGASQVAQAAQMLATGSTQQAASVEQFSLALTDMMEKVEQNAGNAKDSLVITNQAGQLMGQGMASMNDMLTAMQEIDVSSQRIKNVIKVIDDIAFQTNILALNAAVEAARAGQHGKGFAVVADEVRNLASKSAAAAKETTGLIEDSSSRVTEGNQIVATTNESLDAVAKIAKTNLETTQLIADASQEQIRAIGDLNVSIGQISAVVQANSATAQQSAAAAQEMSAQAMLLQQLISRFKLPGTVPVYREQAPEPYPGPETYSSPESYEFSDYAAGPERYGQASDYENYY